MNSSCRKVTAAAHSSEAAGAMRTKNARLESSQGLAQASAVGEKTHNSETPGNYPVGFEGLLAVGQASQPGNGGNGALKERARPIMFAEQALHLATKRLIPVTGCRQMLGPPLWRLFHRRVEYFFDSVPLIRGHSASFPGKVRCAGASERAPPGTSYQMKVILKGTLGAARALLLQKAVK